jgi:hypothetical protein
MPDHPSSPSNRWPFGFTILLSLSVAMFLVGPFLVFFNEFQSAWRQYRINHTYEPVAATVLSTEVTIITGSKGAVHHVPKVRYQYTVNGTSHWSDNLAALSAWGSQAWADAVTTRYPIGQPCKAYYDPQNADQAVLIRIYSFAPYFGMAEMAFCLTVGSFFVLQVWFTKKREPVSADNGWFEVKPEFGERQRLLVARCCTAVWYGFGAVPAVHYYLFVPPPHSQRAEYCFLGFALLGFIPLGRMIYYQLMNRNLDEAWLRLDQPAAFLGRRIKFVVSQSARRQLQLKDVRVRLLCIGTKAQGRSRIRRTIYETTAIECKDHTLHAGEDLEFSGELTLPPEQRPTGRDPAREFDQIDWLLRLDCAVAHAPDYKACFPINVLTAAASEEPLAAPGEKPRAFVDVRLVDPEFAGRILTRHRLVMAYLIGTLPLLAMLVGLGLLAAGYPTVFPKDADFPRWFAVSRPQGEVLFVSGCILAFVGTVWGIAIPSLLSNRYNYGVVRNAINCRRDAIVTPGPGTWLVDVVPRSHWNRMMMENAADIGFLAVDEQRREIRFEGDKERYRIPADAIRSCELEKSFLSATARANAPGTWLVVIRAAGPTGIWEAPFGPRVIKGRSLSKAQERTARELHARIKALLPAAQP